MGHLTPGSDWFYEHVIIETDDCIISPYLIGGYGSFTLSGVNYRMHRVACEMEHGPPPADKPYATHQCLGGGNPACINRRHLKWGSPKDNVDDCRAAGRMGGGAPRDVSESATACAREVEAMADSGATYGAIASALGISYSRARYLAKRARE